MTNYRSLFQVREFRYLYSALALSQAGDQVSAVAAAVLVFDQTGSGFMSALAYASGWLPGVIGGPLLASYADRLPRRAVMIVCDIVRAVLIAALALPGMPVGLAIVLLFVAHMATSPFTAARAAVMPEVLTGEAYITGNGLTHVTQQVTQIGGFPVGGLMVSLISPEAVFLVNAGSFVLSAVLVRVGVRERPVPPSSTEPQSLLRDSLDGMRYVFRDPWLQGCLLVVCFGLMFAYAPEAILYPYAVELGWGATAAGVMLAAPPVGFVIGAVVLTRLVQPQVRDRLLVPAALLATAALIPALLDPPLPVVLGLLFLAGLGTAFSAALNAIFVRRVAPNFRGRAMGVAVSGINVSQGLGFLAAGAVVDWGLNPSTVTGMCGVVGTVVVAMLARRWSRGATIATTADDVHAEP